jgi:hypothetical protein
MEHSEILRELSIIFPSLNEVPNLTSLKIANGCFALRFRDAVPPKALGQLLSFRLGPLGDQVRSGVRLTRDK